MLGKPGHWTERSSKDYQFRVSADFVAQLESRLDDLGWSQAKLAQELGVTEGRISQILNNPGNFSLNLMVKCVRALRMKMAIVAYDDGDVSNLMGPVNSEIFRLCWEKTGKPSDFWEVDQADTAKSYSGNIYVCSDTFFVTSSGSGAYPGVFNIKPIDLQIAPINYAPKQDIAA